jgi:26S proteasome regulatory subunit (ATPase 3-interacting protein)
LKVSDHVADDLDSFWQLVTDSLPPQDAETLIEDLGIEFDTTEHKVLEKGPLCAIQGTNTRNNLKRKRE